MREIEIHDYARQLLRHTVPRQLRKPPRTPSTSKRRAILNWPGPGGISERHEVPQGYLYVRGGDLAGDARGEIEFTMRRLRTAD
jgi:hypothetical protein